MIIKIEIAMKIIIEIAIKKISREILKVKIVKENLRNHLQHSKDHRGNLREISLERLSPEMSLNNKKRGKRSLRNKKCKIIKSQINKGIKETIIKSKSYSLGLNFWTIIKRKNRNLKSKKK